MDTPTPVDLGAVETPEASFEAALAAAVASVPEAANAAPEATVPAEPVAAAPVAAPVQPEVGDLRVGDLEARLRAAEEALEAAKAAPPAVETDWSRFIEDPIGTIRKSNPNLTPADAAKVAENLYFHALGENAPIEWRLKQGLKQENPEVVALKAQVAQLTAAQNEEKRAAQIAAYQGELRSHGAQLAAEQFPVLSNLAKRDPDTFTEVLYSVAVQEARSSQGKNILTAAQAAERAEKFLQAQRDKLYGPPATAEVTASSPSLFGKDLAAQPSKSTPSVLDDKALRAAALKAAGVDVPVWD
jgi:hypothetical protein